MTPADLKQTRESLHISQAELARQLGVAANTVNRWEAGTRAIPPYLPLALAGIECSGQRTLTAEHMRLVADEL